MITEFPPPPGAVRTTMIVVHKSTKVSYYTWEKDGQWFWQVGGVTGSAPTKDLACDLARRYVRDGS
jgi:hypothetical protein